MTDPRTRYSVRDCPAHTSCALAFESGTLCLACGQQVLDTIDGLATIPPGEGLLVEARAAWQENQAVRDFTADARTHRTGAGDADELEATGTGGEAPT